MVRRRSSPATPGWVVTVVSGRIATVDIALGDGHPGLAGELVLVELLDAVLPAALAIDEAEEVGGQARFRTPADLRVHPLRLRLEADAGDPAVACRLADPVGQLGLDAAGEDDVLLPAREALAEGRLGCRVEVQQAHERPGRRVELLGRDEVG